MLLKYFAQNLFASMYQIFWYQNTLGVSSGCVKSLENERKNACKQLLLSSKFLLHVYWEDACCLDRSLIVKKNNKVKQHFTKRVNTG